MSPYSPRRRGTLLALGAVALAGVLGLAEWALRAADAPRFDACRMGTEEPWSPDPEVGFVLAPHTTVGPGRTNELGLRGAVLPLEKAEGERRVLFVGDSTAWGLDVPEKASFAARSTELLAAAFPGASWTRLNGAVPGHTSFQSLGMLRRLLDYAPDYVVFYVGARNDASRARYFSDSEIPTRLQRLQEPWHEVRVLRLLEAGRDRFFRSLLRKLRPKREQARVTPEVFRENLQQMLESTARSGAGAVVLVPPTSERLLAKYPALPEYSAILEEVAAEFGAPAVPLQDFFRDGDEDALYREDGYHFNESGHAVAAAEIARAVEKLETAGARGEDRSVPSISGSSR